VKISETEAAKIGVLSFVIKPLNKAEFAKTFRKVRDEVKGSMVMVCRQSR
jgi:YesN/AraC family two-component response regulator